MTKCYFIECQCKLEVKQGTVLDKAPVTILNCKNENCCILRLVGVAFYEMILNDYLWSEGYLLLKSVNNM